MDPQDNSCYRGETAETLAWRVADLERENAELREKNAQLSGILRSVPAFIFTLSPDYRIQYLNHHQQDCHDEPLNRHVRDFTSPEEAEKVEAAIRRVLETGSLEICSVRSTTTGRMLQARYAPLPSSDPLLVVGVSLDVTEEHNERSKLEQTRDEIEAALVESDERFRIMVETTPVPVVISDLDTSQVLYGNRALAETFATPFETLQEQLTSQFYADPEQRRSLVERIGNGEQIRGMTMKLRDAQGNIIWAAVYLDRITYGGRPALLACFLDISARKQREVEILRDRRALRRLLDMNERDRRLIAYEIHDGVVQDMTGALMFLQTSLSLAGTELEGREELRRGTQLLSSAICELRDLLNGLRPLSLEEGGVIAAIDDLVSRSDEEGYEIDFMHEVTFDRIAPSLEMAIYRTVQEGVNNARRHSGSDQARVRIHQPDSSIQITIQDQGRGFDPHQVDPRRYGLQGIRERAQLLGGQATIKTAPGQGTKIDVTLPLEDYLEGDFPDETTL